jgi:hypothetical protein
MDALPRHAKMLRALPFFLLWLAGLTLCAQFNWVLGSTDAPVKISAASAMLSGLPWLSVEIIALYFILRPNSFRWSWGRALAGLGVMAPWCFFNAGPAVLQLGWWSGWWSGWNFAHAYWLLGVTAVLIVLFVVSLIGALLAAKKTLVT